MAKSVQASELEIVQSRLRRRDYASYLSVRLSPEIVRPGLFWLYGFFHEVGQIPFKVDEPLLGEIRLQWWRDAFLKLERGDRVGHPVADGLGPLLVEGGEALRLELNAVVDSFQADVQKSPMPDMATFFQTLDKRYGGILRAALTISELSGGTATNTQTIITASEAGMAIGAVTLFAQLPLYLQKGLSPLPSDMLAAHGLSHQDFIVSSAKLDEIRGQQIEKALYAVAEGAVVISWDIKARLTVLNRAERLIFGPWVSVPALLKKSINDRRRGKAVVTTLNPLRIYMSQMRASV